MLRLNIHLPIPSTVLLNQCLLHWDQLNGCSGIGLGLLIGNSFGFLRFEASHSVTAELQATRLPFLRLYTESSRSPWNFNGYCHFVQWSREDKEGCCHSWTSVGFRDGCTRVAVCIVSPLWKASSGNPSILGPSTMFFPHNKGNQISKYECESHWPLWDVLLISKL